MSDHSQFTASAAFRFLPLFRARLRPHRRAPRFDLNALPDHLKRDLGFLGGHDNPPVDPLRD
jgi:hypothetical protein